MGLREAERIFKVISFLSLSLSLSLSVCSLREKFRLSVRYARQRLMIPRLIRFDQVFLKYAWNLRVYLLSCPSCSHLARIALYFIFSFFFFAIAV